MTQTAIVLGANGRFGRAAVLAFTQEGWKMKAFARKRSGTEPSANVEIVTGNAFDEAELTAACSGADVIVNALNPPYERWSRDLPRLTSNVIAAAATSSATVMIPGNVYNYGTRLSPILTENTPQHADTKKGRLRIEMERAYADAAERGVRTIIIRGGDFIESLQTGNWFDSYIANKSGQGKTTYPGPLDTTHAWAYLPDMARAMVLLAGKREQFEAFEEFGFAGYSLTGRELVAAIEQATGTKQKVGSIPWPLMRIISLFSPRIREVLEMRYLWNTPHEIDGRLLAATIPDFSPTPLDMAIREALALGHVGNREPGALVAA